MCQTLPSRPSALEPTSLGLFPSANNFTLRQDEMDKSEKIIDDEVGRLSENIQDSNLFLDPQSEKKLVRKLDIWIAPVMTIIFLTAYLDRANIGNAASAGMT